MDTGLVKNKSMPEGTLEDVKKFLNQLKIMKLEKELLEVGSPEVPTKHDFSDGVYIRTMLVPANNFVIGKRHRKSTFNILLKGSATLYAGENLPVKKIKAPFTFVSDPGVKKMAFFHEDSEWINVHPTEEKDLEIIEKEFIMSDEEYLQIEGGKLCLGAQ